ncbi:LysR family transcriptional regulator [Plantactinospora endophytica]|uniref:LysR family transcriptional regulator n=1 Tax=Plantactinospora endophytica TaxID=673535 RepID=A0ABQ4E8S5_9ACTN|nr:LysR substrate-binding domain-containing protein [Plantactinospora endophytica]GIG91135.1 LysR family transcriptional regulator [Plantactinospora endophytica]
MDVHLRELRYFVAVAEELHFTRAAERLFVSQPALSKQIRALETRLGFPLFGRTAARGVWLTPAGGALLPAARQTLATFEEGLTAARPLARRRTFTVGMQTAVGRDLQGPALQAFQASAEGWTVSIRLVGWTDPTAGLADGSSDVAFVWLPVPADGLDTRTLARERRWVALAANHRLAGTVGRHLDSGGTGLRPAGTGEAGAGPAGIAVGGAVVTGPDPNGADPAGVAEPTAVRFTDLLAEPFVALPAAAGPLRDFWLGLPERGGRAPVVAGEASTPDEVFEMVAAGLGVALLAEGNVDLYRRRGVVCRPVHGLAPAELAVAWRVGDERKVVADFLHRLPAPL